jgi:hypothetical protein
MNQVIKDAIGPFEAIAYGGYGASGGEQQIPIQAPECFSHFFGVAKHGRQRFAAVQFFVGPNHVTPPSYVLLGQTARSVTPRCHWVAYYGGKVAGYDGEIADITAGDVR